MSSWNLTCGRWLLASFSLCLSVPTHHFCSSRASTTPRRADGPAFWAVITTMLQVQRPAQPSPVVKKIMRNRLMPRSMVGCLTLFKVNMVSFWVAKIIPLDQASTRTTQPFHRLCLENRRTEMSMIHDNGTVQRLRVKRDWYFGRSILDWRQNTYNWGDRLRFVLPGEHHMLCRGLVPKAISSIKSILLVNLIHQSFVIVTAVAVTYWEEVSHISQVRPWWNSIFSFGKTRNFFLWCVVLLASFGKLFPRVDWMLSFLGTSDH